MKSVLSVKTWSAWSPFAGSKEDWLHWSKKQTTEWNDKKINAVSIPKMLKRRCSHTSQMALEVAGKVLEKQSVDYAVFCSQHGELNCTFDLLKAISDQSMLSPAGFSQSVHNTSAGLFSVIYKMQQNINSIAAGEYTFLAGMLEVFSWLKLHPNKTVLLVVFDDYLPHDYQTLEVQSNFRYAFSLLLTNKRFKSQSESFVLSLQLDMPGGSISRHRYLPQGLEFLAWMLQADGKTLVQHTNNQQIIWQKQ